MYKIFYNMQKEPFENYPLTDIFYNSHIHHDAWRYLARGIKQKDPVLFVTGEYGTGKTLLCLKLVKIFINKKTIPFVFIPTPNYSFPMILEKSITVLEISYNTIGSPPSESDLLNIIYEYFEKIDDTNGKYIYIIIDEAQDISYSFANKLKLLLSFNCSEHFPFKLILFGHMHFLNILDQKNLISLRQRIKKVFYLKPFGFNETKEYIYFRLIYSGASGTPVFDDSAISIIQFENAGIPQLINNICDNCLIEAGNKKVNSIDVSIIQTIVRWDMHTDENPDPSPSDPHIPIQQRIVDPEKKYNNQQERQEKNDFQAITDNKNINRANQAGNNTDSKHLTFNSTKDNIPENQFIPVTENKNNRKKSEKIGKNPVPHRISLMAVYMPVEFNMLNLQSTTTAG